MNCALKLMPVLLCALLSGCIPATTRAGSPSGSQDVYQFPDYLSVPGPVILDKDLNDQTPNDTYVSLEGCSAVAKASDVRKMGLEISRETCIRTVKQNKTDQVAYYILGITSTILLTNFILEFLIQQFANYIYR
jgi:hypothetical protein